jgi:hypothetical protein
MDYLHHARLTIMRREMLARNVPEGRLGLREATVISAAHFLRQAVAKSRWPRPY